jgi:hypothetical protein
MVDMSQDLRANKENGLEQLQTNRNANGTEEENSGR